MHLLMKVVKYQLATKEKRGATYPKEGKLNLT